MVDIRWHPVVRFPIGKNLLPLLAYLKEKNIRYHVTEDNGQQQLLVADSSQIYDVAEYASLWIAGELTTDGQLSNAGRSNTGRSNSGESNSEQPLSIVISKLLITLHLFRVLPVTMATMSLGFIGTILFQLDDVRLSYIGPFLFQKIHNGDFLSLEQTLTTGEYWRLLTPAFLHFSFLHILFNALFIWVIGQRIELAKGTKHYLVVIVLIGLIANIAQYIAKADTIFGGLSGVVYGVIGYIAVYQRYIKHPILYFDQSMIIMFIVMLLLGVLGVMDWFIAGSVANTAHIAGLVSGAIIGWLVALLDRRKSE